MSSKPLLLKPKEKLNDEQQKMVDEYNRLTTIKHTFNEIIKFIESGQLTKDVLEMADKKQIEEEIRIRLGPPKDGIIISAKYHPQVHVFGPWRMMIDIEADEETEAYWPPTIGKYPVRYHTLSGAMDENSMTAKRLIYERLNCCENQLDSIKSDPFIIGLIIKTATEAVDSWQSMLNIEKWKWV